MRIERLNLADDGRVSLTAYLLDTSTELPALDKRPAVVICPGGGYAYTSDREAEPIALTFSAQGYQTFVLRYSIKEYAAFPNSLVDLAKAVALIRRQADDLNIFAERIAVAGFSAGGHLAASLGVFLERSGNSGACEMQRRREQAECACPLLSCNCVGR